MLCGLLAPLGHDLDLGLGHGRPLLGGGKSVLEGGELGHQVALGQERIAQLGLVSVNLFFTSFAKQARRSRKGGFTGCANVISPIPVTT